MESALKGPLLLLSLLFVPHGSSAENLQNFCSNSTVLRTRSACHSCSASLWISCPRGYTQTPGSTAKDCKYYIRTITLNLSISGCSFECYREVETKICCPGFWGPDCMECPEEASRPCSNNGVCSDGLGGNGTCLCKAGYAGTACEECASGRYGRTCSSECACVHGLCDTGRTGTGSCLCFSGYKGPRCDQELPECAALNCGKNSRCVEEAATGQLLCQCLLGYRRDSASSACISIDPCVQKPCHAHATCLHTGPNLHLCSCKGGYTGDGLVCMPYDPCQSNHGGCSANSTRCVYDGPGKSHCECLLGFESLINGHCSLTNKCQPESCDKNAVCSTVGAGSVECTCLPGYVGNGKVCYGSIAQRLKELNTKAGGKWHGQLSHALKLFESLMWPLENLGPFTIFVPVNNGFKEALVKSLTMDITKTKYLCKMHLVAGIMPLDTLKRHDIFYTLTGRSVETDTSAGAAQTKIRTRGSRKKAIILESDVVASNGMIHIISKVMTSVSPTVESNTQENLKKIISDNYKFAKFQAFLETVDLWSLMDTSDPLTVFAPVSVAFDNMQNGQMEYLARKEGRTKLVEFLRNHIVQSTSLEIYNAVSSPRLSTMANQVLTINVTDTGRILINGAPVVEAAVEAKNGRLYILDGVLIPASIEPILPHRCDVTETKVIKRNCTSCSKAKACPSGEFAGATFGCVYPMRIGQPSISLLVTGCAPMCNLSTTTKACCPGFYGTDCRPCPGGFDRQCSGHGQCMEGLTGNGTCLCEPNFRGSRCQYCSSSDKYGPRCDKPCLCLHGVCDHRPDSEGRCKPNSCQKGFTGTFCDQRTTSCGFNFLFCHAHAFCDFSNRKIRCVCKPGYDGDGITCVESDPCAPPLRGGCSLNAKCIKTGVGTHSCQCLSGWKEDGENDCQPINNCEAPNRGGCHPNATCVYVGPGQSDCICKSGYKGDGLDCEAVNPCVTATGGCHYLASCRLVLSEWRCVCDERFTGDGYICYGSLEHELSILPEASEFYAWLTESGVSLSGGGNNVTLLVPSSEAVKLSVEDMNFWMAKGNLPSLVRNHILPGTFELHTLNNISSVTSLLKTSLSVSTSNEETSVGGAAITVSNLAATNGLMHIINKVLFPDRKLSEGLLATLALRPELSLFRSYLIEYNLTEEIEQGSEFTIFAPTDSAINTYLKSRAVSALDLNTTRYHVLPSLRLLKTDLQTGGYKPTMLGQSYQLGLYPRDGKLFVSDAAINFTNILSGRGVIHTLMSVLRINKNRCDKTKHLITMGNCDDCFHPQKICPNDFFPDKSQKRSCLLTRMFDDKPMRIIGCRSTCIKPKLEPLCCSGFFGVHCEACPGPSGEPCFSNGHCSDGTNGTGVCVCTKGFNGTACETCDSGKYGIHCDQECLCKNGRCNEGIKGDGTCECDVGWRGIFCDEKVEFKSEELCGSAKCHSSANCVITSSGPQCLCAAGFEGNGTFCQAKDPCVVENGGCSLNAVCKRTRPGQRQCVCKTGHSGDGLVCVEINPCLETSGECSVNAECIHVGPNKSSCACREGYEGNGKNCLMVDLCKKKNGGCHKFARCNTTSPNVRTCACRSSYTGDGLTCKGTVGNELLARKHKDFFLLLMITEISLAGRGPFTVFTPTTEAFKKVKNDKKIKALMTRKNKELLGTFLRSHIVMCHTLQPFDFTQPRNLTTLSGHVLKTQMTQGNISVNEANITYSDGLSVNGIFHEIDNILFYPNEDQLKGLDENLNLTDVAERNGYGTFIKLLEEAGLSELLRDALYQPLTIFLPSDAAMASLPQEQKNFLYHPQNRPQLQEYLKYHIIHTQKIYAEGLVHLDLARTLQGSALSFSCGGSDNIGEIFVNGKCRLIQRHQVFNGGVAYGIDCLLNPPSLGGRCDRQDTFEQTTNCDPCSSKYTRCPKGSKIKEKQKCDLPAYFVTKNTGCRSVCTVTFWRPTCCRGFFGRDCLACPGGAKTICNNRGKCDDGHLGNGTCSCQPRFEGDACELCSTGFYGPSCKACNCTEHGSCDDGIKGTGLCFCEEGWTGEQCESQLEEIYKCSPQCSPKAVCQQNNTCVCRPFHEGDGFTCTIVDKCQIWNGGCAQTAKCTQTGDRVSCTCSKGYSGDGHFCQPIDPCAAGDNGKCHEHATCTMTAPGKRRCICKNNYIGDGLTCEVKQLPISRCLQNNGLCDQEAKCSDLHYEDSMLGVFHLRSAKGQYKLNYTDAQKACSTEGAVLATYNQLSYAQQGGLNMCAAGWLDQARVAYPTTYSNPNCGFGHVGIVDYGVRKDLSETWDTFCYRIKEVKCECKEGFTGDGLSCIGTLLHILKSTPQFSNFLSQIYNYSEVSTSGKHFVMCLNDLNMHSTLFVPDNSGLAENQTLTQRDIEFHFLRGSVVSLDQLPNGTRIRNKLGGLTVRGVRDLQNPTSLSSRYINDRFVISSDVLASNGIIHVLQGPLTAPPPQPESHVAHRAGLGVGAVLLVFLLAGSVFVGSRFYKRNMKPFRFQYFKEDDRDEDTSADINDRSITNPVYESTPQESHPSNAASLEASDKNRENPMSYDLLQDD